MGPLYSPALAGVLYACSVLVTHAATLKPEPGLNSLSVALSGAEDGDIIELAAGAYREDKTVVANKNVTVVGLGSASPILVDARVVPIAFEVRDGATVKLFNLTLGSTMQNGTCTLPQPNGMKPFSVMGTKVVDGLQTLTYDLGLWPSGRTLQDVFLGDCAWGQGKKPLVFSVSSTTCHGLATTLHSLNYMPACVPYSLDLVDFYTATNTLGMTYADHTLGGNAKPVTSNQSFNVTMQLDIPQSLFVITHSTFPDSVSAMTYFELHDPNRPINETSVFLINITLPNGYTIKEDARGSVNMSNIGSRTVVASKWRVKSDNCGNATNSSTNATCTQGIMVELMGCDVSGTYTFLNIPVVCTGASCPANAPTTFHLAMNLYGPEMCLQQIVEHERRFYIEAVPRTDSTYSTNQSADFIYSVGNNSYWSIVVLPNTTATDITVVDGTLIEVIRTGSDVGACRNNQSWNILADKFKSGSPVYTQKFRGDASPQEIAVELQLLPEIACPNPEKDTEITLQFSVILAYQQQNKDEELHDRNLRRVSRSSRHKHGPYVLYTNFTMKIGMGPAFVPPATTAAAGGATAMATGTPTSKVVATANAILSPNAPPGSHMAVESSSNTAAVVVGSIVGGIVLLVGVGGVYKYQRRRQQERNHWQLVELQSLGHDGHRTFVPGEAVGSGDSGSANFNLLDMQKQKAIEQYSCQV